MRIIAGSHRGRPLHPPKGLTLRPTTDLAKESLFNILNNRIDFEGLSVLDLFAGTGSISFEFASRGAADVVSVEMNRVCIDYISRTARELNFTGLYPVRTNVFSYLKSVRRKFDLVFADPPYEMKETAQLPALIASLQLLNNDGLFILEHDKSLNFSEQPGFTEERKYGKVHFSFFRRPEGITDEP